MTAYIEQQSDHAFRHWLATLDAATVRLDRAAHATEAELRMIARHRQDAA